MRQDRARVQFSSISKFGLLELSRQRLRPALSGGSHITCPRCNGTGHIRDTESSALQILRIIQEVSMKDNTAAVHLEGPVEVTSFRLESVLKIDPDNRAAKRGLVLLGARPADDHVVPVPPLRRKCTVGLEEEDLPKNPIARMMRNPVIRVITFISAGVLLIGLVLLGLFALRPEIRPFITVRVSSTLLTAEARVSTETPTPPLLTPTSTKPLSTSVSPPPLWMLLEATYTPTPRYVDTPHPVLEAYSVGMRRYDRGDMIQVIPFLEQASQEDPTAADILFYLGEAYLQTGSRNGRV